MVMGENIIVIRDPETFFFFLDWSKDIDLETLN